MSGFIYPPGSVYNLLPREEVVVQKPPRYMSKFRPTVLHEQKSTKDIRRTMGPAEVELPGPEKYLKKHSKVLKSPEKAESLKEARSSSTRKPPVPLRTDQPLMGLQTKRDFLKTTTTVPMKPQPTCVDSSKGHKQVLENSGLVPQYIKKKDYGEVPKYLQQRNEEEKMAQEEFKKFVKEQREQRAMKQLSEEERKNILEVHEHTTMCYDKGLKKNWDLLHHEYQGLSFVTDTMTKKAHKKRLEGEMKQLEHHIHRIEGVRTMYIS